MGSAFFEATKASQSFRQYKRRIGHGNKVGTSTYVMIQ